MKKRLISLSVIGLLFFTLAIGAQASADLDPVSGGSYHFTWGAGGAIDHVFELSGESIVPGTWNNSWGVNNTNLGTPWSITVAQDSEIKLISVWQHPDIDPADRVEFTLKYDGVDQDWTSVNLSGPFLGTIANFPVGVGPHTITITADSEDGGAFCQFSGLACAWNLEQPAGGDTDVDGLDLHAAIGQLNTPAKVAAFALEFGRTNCP